MSQRVTVFAIYNLPWTHYLQQQLKTAGGSIIKQQAQNIFHKLPPSVMHLEHAQLYILYYGITVQYYSNTCIDVGRERTSKRNTVTREYFCSFIENKNNESNLQLSILIEHKLQMYAKAIGKTKIYQIITS